jgi:hypothetical protein
MTEKKTKTRKTKARVNVRGLMNSLVVGSDPVYLSRKEYRVSSVRTTAVSLTADHNKRFSITTDEESICITRVS